MISVPLYTGLLYLGKMTLISIFLFGYYRIFLRNANFHPFNRWYLLGSVFLSLTLPILPIPLPAGWMGGERYDGFFSVWSAGGVGNPDELAPLTITSAPPALFYELSHGWRVFYLLYGLVAAVFIFNLLRSLYSLSRLTGKYAFTLKEGVRFFQTEEPGTPFSFLNLLFWNKRLSPDTQQGRFILRHELYHIRQKHTVDILVLAGVRCLFWCNPFFHWILRELKVVHEFLADRYAMAAGTGRYAYAEWLVWHSVHGESTFGDPGRTIVHQGVAHSFFNTPLKRRITMITRFNPRRPGYVSRVMALPLLFVLFAAMAARTTGSGSLARTTGSGSLSVSGGGGTANGPRREAARVDSGHVPINDLIRHYLHRLQYPAVALGEGREETIWFSVRIGDHNRLLQFRQYDKAPETKGSRNVVSITVTSLPARLPNDMGSGAVLTEENKKAVFLEEARKASEKIASDTSRVFVPGEYFFTIVFRIEKPRV